MAKTIKPCRERWKGTMTDRQRFNNQMHYKPVDRCFNMEFGYWNENFKQWSIFLENGITNNLSGPMIGYVASPVGFIKTCLYSFKNIIVY